MSDHMRIHRLHRGSRHFYQLLGPVFGSREIAKAVGISAYDDADKIWITAIVDSVLVGWLSVRGQVVSDCYVKKEHRSRGIMSRLLAEATGEFGPPLRATCTSGSVGVFARQGFKQVRKTTNYTVMEFDHA